MENKASITALMSSFARAHHTQISSNPVFNDAESIKLFSEEEYQTISKYILGGADFFCPDKKGSFKNDEDALKYIIETQLAPTPLARAAFCEESLKTAVMIGTEQYVILGAGLDTFAFREPELMKRLTVFEVDHPLTQQDKLRRTERVGLEIPPRLHFVPCDFVKDNLYERLLSADFDKSKKTFFHGLA